MRIHEFNDHFPDEESCKARFKEIRMRQGVVCPKCGCTHHYWKTSKEMFQCAECGYRQSLRANTVMHGSKLPFRYWFLAVHLLTATKHTFSASELKRQVGMKRYQPVWELLHKLRSAMGKRDGEYKLLGDVEVDEGFFSTETPMHQKGEKLKAGAGSQKKTKVLVMAESVAVEEPRNPGKPKKVRHIKMVVVPDLKAATIDDKAANAIDPASVITTDASGSHKNFKTLFAKHLSSVVDPKDIGKVLPWVHIAIANAKTLFADTYHGVRPEFLQGYLNEFCYKFNRRYFGESLFDRLLTVCADYASDFKHRIYNRNAA